MGAVPSNISLYHYFLRHKYIFFFLLDFPRISIFELWCLCIFLSLKKDTMKSTSCKRKTHCHIKKKTLKLISHTKVTRVRLFIKSVLLHFNCQKTWNEGKGNKDQPLQQHCKRSWTWRWYSEWFMASGRRGLRDSWVLYVLLPCCHHPSLPPLPPETCRGSTLDCCLLYGRRSVLGEPGRSHRGLFHGCPSRLSRHHGRRAERGKVQVF